MANLTKCLICGEKYSYCPSCAGTHAWRFYTDTHEHYQIYMTLELYRLKKITKDEAQSAFNNIGITSNSDLSKFKPGIAEQIKNIVAVDKAANEKTVIKKSRKSKLYNEE